MPLCPAPQVNFGNPVYYENVPNPVALQTFAVYDRLNSGGRLAQISKLFSANGQYYLTPENQGNIAVYNVNGATAWRSNTYVNSGGPFAFYMQPVLLPPLWYHPPDACSASPHGRGLACLRFAEVRAVCCSNAASAAGWHLSIATCSAIGK